MGAQQRRSAPRAAQSVTATEPCTRLAPPQSIRSTRASEPVCSIAMPMLFEAEQVLPASDGDLHQRIDSAAAEDAEGERVGDAEGRPQREQRWKGRRACAHQLVASNVVDAMVKEVELPSVRLQSCVCARAGLTMREGRADGEVREAGESEAGKDGSDMGRWRSSRGIDSHLPYANRLRARDDIADDEQRKGEEEGTRKGGRRPSR